MRQDGLAGYFEFGTASAKTLVMKPQIIESETIGKVDVIQAMRGLLSSDDELDRCCACRALGLLGDNRVVDDLVERLQDKDIDVVIDAVESLGRLGDHRAIAPLLYSLQNDPDGDVKIAVVEALGKIGGDQVADSLIDAAARPPENLEWEEDEEWDSWWDIQRNAVRALGDLGVTKAIPVLNAILEDESGQDIEIDVLQALSRTGEQGEARLITRLAKGSPRDHRRTIKALGSGRSSQGLRTIARRLGDKHEDIRVAAIEALVARGADQYLSAIVLLLRDANCEVRKTALNAVTQMNQTINENLPIEKLLPLLLDQNASVKTATLNILNQHLAVDDLLQLRDTLLNCLDDPAADIVAAACPLAGKIDDDEIITKLLTILIDKEQSPTVRREAALALGATVYGLEHKLDVLTHILTDQEQSIRLAAIQALMMLHQLLPQQALSQPLPEPLSQKSNIDNNAETQSDTPLQIIIDALHGNTTDTEEIMDSDSQSEPVSATPSTLAESDEKSEPENIPAIDNQPDNHSGDNAPTSTLAAIALENIEESIKHDDANNNQQEQTDEMTLSDQDAHELHDFISLLDKQKATKKRFKIKKAIEQPDIALDLRCLCLRVLAQCDDKQVVKAIQDTLQDKQTEIQFEAIEALGRIAERAPDTAGLKETIGPVSNFLQFGNREQRLASIKTLGFVGNKTTLPVLLACMEEKDVMVRIRSIEAVTKILVNIGNKNNRLIIPIHREGKVPIVTLAVDALLEQLKDNDSGVRTTAARSLTEINKLIKQGNSIHKNTIEWLINAGFEDEGGQAREMGKALRLIDPAVACADLLKRLDSLENSLQRRFAIEMLEEIVKQKTTDFVSAA